MADLRNNQTNLAFLYKTLFSMENMDILPG